MKNSNNISLLMFAGVVLIASSCAEPDRKYSEELKHDVPFHQYFGDLDMYTSPSIETYGENSIYDNNMGSRHPVAGTIPRGFMPYMYPNTNEGYLMAGDSLKNPFSNTPENLAKGADVYTKFCLHCHGATGAGDGPVISGSNGKFPPPTSYVDGVSSGGDKMKDLPVGKMYHTITYGRNMMGSHASQLTSEERWKVILHVQALIKQGQAELDKSGASESEETEVVTADGTEIIDEEQNETEENQ
ncbi:MAG: cytochrome C [Bacteroidetes bacterium]|nr:MAG: cytochrome C [Bacteroidota bacterium]